MDPKPLSATFLAARGYCCGSGCRNCPYIPRHTIDTQEQDKKWIAFQTKYPEKTYEEYTTSKV